MKARRLASGKSRDFNAAIAEKTPQDCLHLEEVWYYSAVPVSAIQPKTTKSATALPPWTPPYVYYSVFGTLTLMLAFAFSAVTVIFAVPGATAVILPLSSTETTPGLLLTHFTALRGS